MWQQVTKVDDSVYRRIREGLSEKNDTTYTLRNEELSTKTNMEGS